MVTQFNIPTYNRIRSFFIPRFPAVDNTVAPFNEQSFNILSFIREKTVLSMLRIIVLFSTFIEIIDIIRLGVPILSRPLEALATPTVVIILWVFALTKSHTKLKITLFIPLAFVAVVSIMISSGLNYTTVPQLMFVVFLAFVLKSPLYGMLIHVSGMSVFIAIWYFMSTGLFTEITGIHPPPTLSFTTESATSSLIYSIVPTTLMAIPLIIFTNGINTLWSHQAKINQTLKRTNIKLGESIARETQLVKALESALEKEKDLNQLRANLLQTISHELRTPMAVINTSAHRIKKHHTEQDDMWLKERINLIVNSVEELNTLLTSTMATEEMTDKSRTVNRLSYSFDELCQWMTHTIDQMGSKYEREIIMKTGATSPKNLFTNGEQLSQILTQLVDNAIKYSPSETVINVSVKWNGNLLTLIVDDEGSGIRQGDKLHIFEAFYRGKNSEGISGLGLGLYKVRHMVDDFSGTIFLKPNGERGTSAVVRLPIPQQLDDETGTHP